MILIIGGILLIIIGLETVKAGVKSINQHDDEE